MEKAIRKCLKTKEVQIDTSGGAIHKCMKTGDGGKWVVSGGSWVVRRRESAGADTHLVAGQRREAAGALSVEPWVRDYRMRYYLSSEKLNVLD